MNKINYCDVYMACIWRECFEIETINSLRFQPEFGTANITLNNYTDKQFDYVSSRLLDKRITIHRHNNEKKSNEKLRYIHTGLNPFICLVDNDIVYPDDYLKVMTDASIMYNAYVSLHGAILAPRPLRTYYGDRQVFRGLGTVIKTTEVDIASNCGSVFQRQFYPKGELEQWYDRCNDVSADDIFTNTWTKHLNIPRYVIKHDVGYMKHKRQLPTEEYVFDQHTRYLGISDKYQTDWINANWDNKNF